MLKRTTSRYVPACVVGSFAIIITECSKQVVKPTGGKFGDVEMRYAWRGVPPQKGERAIVIAAAVGK